LRFAVVMMRLKTLLVEFEMLPADTDMAVNSAVTRVLADMLGLPQPGPPPPPMVEPPTVEPAMVEPPV
jgi:hypothetical protein